MVFIDFHSHLEVYSDKQIEEIIKRAREKNVLIIINNSVNPNVNKKTIELSKKYPEIQASLGIYPIDALELSDKEIEGEIDFIKKNKNKIIGIGEVGIDLKESSNFECQKKNFILFIRLANELGVPITVHSRNAEEECIEILEKENAKKVIMHCFSGNLQLVKKIIKNKWYLSIPTIVTFSEHFKKVVEIAPLTQLFCETDSPFLHPIKGKRDNEPANVIFAYKKIAEIKKLSLKDVEDSILENYKILYNINLE